MSELRDIIRQILAEEIQALRQNGAVRQAELVTIDNTRHLNDFARMVVNRAQDPDFAARLKSGEDLFALDGADCRAKPVIDRPDTPPAYVPGQGLPAIPAYERNIITSACQAAGTVRQQANAVVVGSSASHAPGVIEKKLISERDLEGLEPKARLRIAKSAVLTPLAKDEIRRRGISIERISS